MSMCKFFIKDSYLSANFFVLVEKLRLYKFVIIEFLNENLTEVVPKSWIKIDNNHHHQFFCQWPEKFNITKYASPQKNHLIFWKNFHVVLENFSGRFFIELNYMFFLYVLIFCVKPMLKYINKKID